MPTEHPPTETAPLPTVPPDSERDAVLYEWANYYRQSEAGMIDPTGEHGGQFVAFAQGRVIDYGLNPATLRREVATRLGIHPEAVVVAFLYNQL